MQVPYGRSSEPISKPQGCPGCDCRRCAFSVNRPVCMLQGALAARTPSLPRSFYGGGVGRAGEKPAFTRLALHYFLTLIEIENINSLNISFILIPRAQEKLI